MTVTPLFPTTALADPIATVDVDFLADGTDADSLVPLDLSVVSTRELRVLCNQLYSALDADFPPYGAREGYAALVSEIDQRAARARS